MNNRNSFETSFASPEQESKLNQESTWDVLVELSKTETWDEHLEKANNLLKSDDKLTTKEAKEFIDYSEVAKYNKTNHFQSLTSQEKLEREFNSELSHIDDLEMLAEANDPRVEKTSVKYHDQSIPIYILKNYPFKFLAHIINYREDDNITKFGTKTSGELVNNPKKWSEPYQPPKPGELTGGWAVDRENAKSNTLSTSYADGTLRSFDEDLAHSASAHHNSIIYGFDHVRPMSLIYARANDGRIPNHVSNGHIDTLVSSLDQLNTSKGEGFSACNEIAMYRYDEKGQPLEPSFMVTDNLNILNYTESLPEEQTYSTAKGDKYYQKHTNAFYTNRIKQHAAEHEIPIILLDRKSYGDQSERAELSADEHIAHHPSEALAAGMNPDFIKAKLSPEDIWQNYDTLKKHIPNLNVETEFTNLVNDRVTKTLKEKSDTPTNNDQKQAYDEVAYNIIYGPDAYDYIERGGGEQLLEISRKTGDKEMLQYAERLYEHL